MRIIGTNVLVRPLKSRVKSSGGIHFPQQSKYEWDDMQFEVLAVGTGRIVRNKGKKDFVIPLDLEVGDRVLCNRIHGNKFAFDDGSGKLIIEYEEIIAKWKP